MRRRASSLLGVLLLLAVLLGCGRASEELAKLETKQGTVNRDTAKQQGTWAAAAIGAGFEVGDGVRTSSAATARLKLSDGSGVTLQEKTLLRFLASRPGKKSHGLDVQTGEVALDVGRETLEIDTPSGPVRLDPGSRVKLRRTELGTRFQVEIGAAHLTDAHRDLQAGEQIEVGIGSAVIEPSAPPPSASMPAVAPSSAPPTNPVPSASAASDERRPHGPEVVDMMAGPGESLIVHDPHPPTVVGFSGSRCAGLTVLQLGTKKRETIGTGRVTGSFPPGAQRYSLRCDGEATPFAEGTVSVLSDSGSRRLASGAPTNRIDADGRRYTILYQSLLPKVSVRWPNPPSAGPFSLFVRSQGKGQKQFSAPAPSYSLAAGSLAEGTHELWFAAGAEQSRKTTVVVQFDNAAPTASISAPAERGFAAGGAVTVAGMALPGWAVSVAGRELAQDGQQRFSAEVAAPADASSLSIRFAHPQRGVHYYLRRPSR
jgi:hypothetical protein